MLLGFDCFMGIQTIHPAFLRPHSVAHTGGIKTGRINVRPVSSGRETAVL